MTWAIKRIADLGRVITGKTPATGNPEFFDGDYPFVTPSDIDYANYYCQKTERTVTDSAREKHANQFVPKDAIMFTCIGNTIGKCAIALSDSLTNQQINSVVANKCTDAKFIYYLLCNNVASIRPLGGGSATPIINKTDFESIEFRVPPHDAQKQIGEFLSAYDDLIENNRRRMALLEESARLLYREWFIRLRFPGYEYTSINDGVPEGWRSVSLDEISIKIGSGFTPRGGEASYLPEGITLIRSMNVYDDNFDDNGLAFLSEEQAATLAGVSVEAKDILINITGASVARCCMAPERYLPARVNQHVMIIRVDPNKADPFFVHKAINSDERKRQLLSYAQKGSTREALTKEGMARFKITVPTATLMRQFGEIAAASFKQREVLAQQSQKLRTARDLLLPRLMSGELAV